MQFNKKNNTIKNKRKIKSRTRCIRNRKSVKGGDVKCGGGGIGGILKKMYLCHANPTAQCVITSLDRLDQVADMPSSLRSLTSYVEIAKKLLEFYKSIDISAIRQPIQYSKLTSTFKKVMRELEETIEFLEEAHIIRDLAKPSGNDNLIKFINVTLQTISSSSLSDVSREGKIAIWANWYRSNLENMISKLTVMLTQINSIYISLPMNTASHVSSRISPPSADNSMSVVSRKYKPE